MERVLISLVITTYNRATLLADALKSVAASRIENHGDVEVIVVDNNSTDGTRQTVDKIMADGFPFVLRYVFEPNQGLSHARNRGADEASGLYIAFMDDDERIDEDYLARLEPAFRSTQAICIGGPYVLCDNEPMPGWLPPLLQLSTGQQHYGKEVKVLDHENGRLLGGNMAFIRQELLDIGKYNTHLGRSGSSLLAGEDYELQDRLHKAGKKVVFHPGLIQYTPLAPGRSKKSFWRRQRFDRGRTLYRRRLLDGELPKGPYLFNAPRWLWRDLFIRDIPKMILSLAHLDMTESFYRQLDAWTRLGQIQEAREAAKRTVKA